MDLPTHLAGSRVATDDDDDRVYRVHSWDYTSREAVGVAGSASSSASFHIWGLTANILTRVAEVALAQPPAFDFVRPRSTAALRPKL